MHHGSVVFSSEDITGASHVGGKLINLLCTADHFLYYVGITQIAHDEFIRWGL
jgi:hypothetical protein